MHCNRSLTNWCKSIYMDTVRYHVPLSNGMWRYVYVKHFKGEFKDNTISRYVNSLSCIVFQSIKSFFEVYSFIPISKALLSIYPREKQNQILSLLPYKGLFAISIDLRQKYHLKLRCNDNSFRGLKAILWKAHIPLK